MAMRVSPRLTHLQVLGNGVSIPLWRPGASPTRTSTTHVPLPASLRLRRLPLAILSTRHHNTLRTSNRLRLNITLRYLPTIRPNINPPLITTRRPLPSQCILTFILNIHLHH